MAMASANKILVVDDDTDVITIIKKALEKDSFKVDTFTEPLKALEHFAAHSTDYGIVISYKNVCYEWI